MSIKDDGDCEKWVKWIKYTPMYHLEQYVHRPGFFEGNESPSYLVHSRWKNAPNEPKSRYSELVLLAILSPLCPFAGTYYVTLNNGGKYSVTVLQVVCINGAMGGN